MKSKLLLLIGFLCFSSIQGQDKALNSSIRNFFENYSCPNYRPRHAMEYKTIEVNKKKKEIIIYANDAFCSQVFTAESTDFIYDQIKSRLPKEYKNYQVFIKTDKNKNIEELVPNAYRNKGTLDKSRLLRKTDYDETPWVRNISLPYKITAGLQNRHLFIWASHGRYFKEDPKGKKWKWQRPYLFCTTEDLLTQSFVYPYLFPMLENAGAIIGTPRERDYQTQQVIIDNNVSFSGKDYRETNGSHDWTSSAQGTGFKPPLTIMNDNVFPFRSGTYRMVPSTNKANEKSTVSWTPQIKEAGKYAVYISYASSPQNITDAHYSVFHKGGETEFLVNQQIGGGTWVYLGTFDFDTESRSLQGVVLDNYSKEKGIVTADAVRFGGGMGQIERGDCGTSGLPKYLEAARYYAQWAGIPDTLVNTTNGKNDYADDLRVRGNMVNYLGGGSVYQPHTPGKGVPFELALALHSDAGIQRDHSIHGSLSIGTTQVGDSMKTYPSGISRNASSDFSALLLNGLSHDLSAKFNIPWIKREHWDRNYAETRIPGVPSAILEMLAHQNFTDMKYGHDPIFKFTLARSVYKSILRYICTQHNIKKYCVQPLPVRAFAAELTEDGKHVRLTWSQTIDPVEETATPNRYILYTKTGNRGFDNGQDLGDCNSCLVAIRPDTHYAFRITAVNDGGESFPSETLTAYQTSHSSKRILIVNGFHRLSGPAQVISPTKRGFDLERDLGVPYMRTTAFAGKQQIFDVSAAGLPDSIAWGLSGEEYIGQEFAGNTFDYPVSHGLAIAATGKYSYCSVSREAFEQNGFRTESYQAIDYIAGLEGNFRHNLYPFKTLPGSTQQKLTDYLQNGGALLLSGAFVASDCQSDADDRRFIENVLKYRYAGTMREDSVTAINGLNINFDIYRMPNKKHYAAQRPDVILPTGKQAFPCFIYGNGQGAGVAYKGRDYRVLTMSFPFECICDEAVRRSAMSAVLSFLTD